MRKKCTLIFTVLTLLICIYPVMGQDQINVTPTELEQAKLGKLKAQNESFNIQLQQINTQIQALTILKQLTTEHQQSKYSELLGYADSVKKAHADWGDSAKIQYDPSNGEYGNFTKKQEVKKEEPTNKK